jgi:hypothetical protein
VGPEILIKTAFVRTAAYVMGAELSIPTERLNILPLLAETVKEQNPMTSNISPK